jgi:glucokinase
MKALLGIDWGGTYIKAGIVDKQGRIKKRVVYASKDLQKKDVFIRQLQALIKSMGALNIQGLGIGAPGIVDVDRGFIYYLPNVPGWKNFPLGEVLRKKLKIPIFINNDANTFALAESTYGAARGAGRSICLTLGTGLGGAVVFEGRLLRTSISAHELGHVPLALRGAKCGCGGRGCIETFVGSKYLLRRYGRLSGKDTKGLQVKDIFERARKGQGKALLVWQEFSQALGKFLAGMVNVFNPEIIVFGGGVSGAFSLFRPLVWEVIKKQAMWPQVRGLKLARARLRDSGIIGAALLVDKGNVS